MAEAKAPRAKKPSKTAEKAPEQSSEKLAPAPEASKTPDAPQDKKSGYVPKEIGAPLFKIQDVPREMQDAAKQRFGTPGLTMQAGIARENGTYKGEVLVGESYMAQKVGNNSVVFHKKSDVELASERHQQDPRRVNGAEMALHYNGAVAKAYPHDPQRENLDIMVNTMKKQAEKLGLGEGGKFAQSLEKVKEGMWADMVQRREAQREAQTARRQERQDRSKAERGHEMEH